MSEPVYAFGGRKTTTVVVYDRNKRRSAESQTIGRNVSFFSTRSRNASFIRFPTRRRRKLRATAIRFGRETTIEYYSIKRYIVVFQTIFWNDTCWILIVLTRRPLSAGRVHNGTRFSTQTRPPSLYVERELSSTYRRGRFIGFDGTGRVPRARARLYAFYR